MSEPTAPVPGDVLPFPVEDTGIEVGEEFYAWSYLFGKWFGPVACTARYGDFVYGQSWGAFPFSAAVAYKVRTT